ncbi:hypothetical protein ACFYMI_23175 [Streptomyces collinus]|uniref:hypothetical protein n=1 Tax=Streptomyces collinus TaxID=42684 RepID=UPI0036AAB5AB
MNIWWSAPSYGRCTNWSPWALPVAVALLTTSCAGQDGNASTPEAAASPSAPHGYVEGAQERAEQQSRLVLNDPETGDSRVLDLITEKAHEVPRTTGTTRLTTDGRFAYFHTAGGTRLLDSVPSLRAGWRGKPLDLRTCL